MRLGPIGTLLLLLSVAAIPLFSQESASRGAVEGAERTRRGKYLVEQVGMCQDCHTPMNEKGEYVKEKWLQGAPILFKPTVPIPAWAERTVHIAGLPGWTDEQAITFLMTGKDAKGMNARPPMPAYRFNRKDAEAITAYLRSLGSESAGDQTASKNKQAKQQKE